jgi:predicted O-methyltransferase YrrM
MDYRTFFKNFGGSARTKNVRSPTWWPFGPGARNRDKPIVQVPHVSGLPKEFIRLCPWEMEFLYAVARRAKHGLLEIGRFNGGSTFLLACANRSVPIWSIDVAPRDDEMFRELARSHSVGANVQLIVGDSQHTKYPQIKAFDFLFIDGDHSYNGCSADIRNWFDALLPGGYAIFHDSYAAAGNDGVQDAILDFMDMREDVEIIVSPLIGMSYWRYPAGSMACLRKRKNA